MTTRDSQEPGENQLDKELSQSLEELRVALPGMQMLFAFLLTIPFAQGFERVTYTQKWIFFAALSATTFASLFLIAPSFYHRLHWRCNGKDKQRMLRVFNMLAICGGVFLSLALVTSMYFITDYLFDGRLPIVSSSVVGATCLALWYGLPLMRRSRERR